MVAAEKLHAEVRRSGLRSVFDETGSIGKRYYRQDEIGTPFCVTIDFDTVEKDQSATVRHRDTKTQERVAMDRVVDYLKDQIANWTLKV